MPAIQDLPPLPIRRLRVSAYKDAPQGTWPCEVWIGDEPEPYLAYDPLVKIVLAALTGLREKASVALTVDANRVVYRAEASIA